MIAGVDLGDVYFLHAILAVESVIWNEAYNTEFNDGTPFTNIHKL